MEPTRSSPRRSDLVALQTGAPVQVAPGELVPVAATLDLDGKIALSIPLGAYVVDGDSVRFVNTVDVVGLVAVLTGTFVGWRLGVVGIRALGEVLRRGR